nr:hypothetical protein B7F21.60 [imported] - Neurospora crassa [Neurospora crassa]
MAKAMMKDGDMKQMGAGYVQHVDDSSSLGLSVKVTREANFGLERGAASLANKDPLAGYIFRPMCGEESVKTAARTGARLQQRPITYSGSHPLTLSPYLKPFLRWVGVINRDPKDQSRMVMRHWGQAIGLLTARLCTQAGKLSKIIALAVMASVPYYSNLNADRLAKRGDRRLYSAPPSLRLTPRYALLCRTAQPDDVVNGGDSKTRPKRAQRAALVPLSARFDHRLERAGSCMH